jgi:polysaccharide deacetylase family protein (PEP-CTERM system associated)
MSSAATPGAVVNVMTVDVEDYFHVSGFEGVVRRDAWGDYESRVVANTERLLEVLAAHGVRGTFFVLGWVAHRFPALVRSIAGAGHDLASHSYWHRLVYDLTPDEFRDDLRRAKDAIESAGGKPVVGFRAPSFSITRRSLWALDVLAEEGYAYDASVFPVRHDRYGIPGAPRHPFRVACAGGELVEVPGTRASAGPVPVPVGGGYFRLLPYQATRWAIRHLNESEGQPAVFYVHPWEVDPDQPRLPAPWLGRLRHYNQLGRTASRLSRLLSEFRFGSIESVLLPHVARLPHLPAAGLAGPTVAALTYAGLSGTR